MKLKMENNKYPIICTGRQVGSGGGTIARLLAKEFGAKLYDKELLNLAARESGFSEKFFEQNDEHRSFLKSLFHLTPHINTDINLYNNNFSEEGLFLFQSEAIRKAAQEGPCVFVGRTADYILRDNPNAVSVFITANEEQRIATISERLGIDNTAARKFISDTEDKRSTYYNYYTGRKWGHADSYDLCVNSTLLGIEETARFIAGFVKQKLEL